MMFNLFRKPTAPDAVFEAYRSIVAQSRQEKFYADWGVPDTVTGRFDMISLHLALLLHRLRGEPAARPFAQAVVDLFFRDMDRSLRELGVTDLGVPKKIKKMGNVFYGLVEAVSKAIDSGSTEALEDVLQRNIYGENGVGAAALAAYARDEASQLAARSTETIAGPAGVAA